MKSSYIFKLHSSHFVYITGFKICLLHTKVQYFKAKYEYQTTNGNSVIYLFIYLTTLSVAQFI